MSLRLLACSLNLIETLIYDVDDLPRARIGTSKSKEPHGIPDACSIMCQRTYGNVRKSSPGKYGGKKNEMQGGGICRLSGKFRRLNRGLEAAVGGSGGRSPPELVAGVWGAPAPPTRGKGNGSHWPLWAHGAPRAHRVPWAPFFLFCYGAEAYLIGHCHEAKNDGEGSLHSHAQAKEACCNASLKLRFEDGFVISGTTTLDEI